MACCTSLTTGAQILRVCTRAPRRCSWLCVQRGFGVVVRRGRASEETLHRGALLRLQQGDGCSCSSSPPCARCFVLGQNLSCFSLHL
jgi:hypothetical protein